MTLGQKALTILSFTVVGLMTVLCIASRTFIVRSFSDLEEQQTRVDVDRARNQLFYGSLANLASTANDYGAWDKMYGYVFLSSPKPIAEEFQDGTLQSRRINSVLVTDADGQIVFYKAYDYRRHTQTSSSLEIETTLAFDPWVKQVLDSSTPASGILTQPGGPVLIAACPIVTTNHKGPARGVVVMTRNLDAGLLADLQALTHLRLSVENAASSPVLTDFQSKNGLIAQEEKTLVKAADDNMISGYTLLPGIHGDAALVLRVDEERHISQSGLISLRYFLAALCFIGITFGITTWFLLHNVVLSRLSQLHAQVAEIGGCTWTAKHVTTSGSDEISELGRAINSMLDTVRNTETKLDLLANNIQQVFWVKDAPSLKFTYVSSGYAEIWGQSSETLFSNPESWMRAVHPEDQKLAEESLRIQRRGEQGDIEFRIIRPDGRICWVWERFFAVLDADGRVQQFVGILEDITEYKGAEEILLHSQDELWDAMVHRKEKLQMAAASRG
jgi:PAS domain S-box-containing protein